MIRTIIGRPAVRLLGIAVLLAIYLLTLGSVQWGDVAVGLVLATAVEIGWRRRAIRGKLIESGTYSGPPRPPVHKAILATPALLYAIVAEITAGTWKVAQYSLGLREVEHDGIVEIELGEMSKQGAVLLAFVSTSAPGEVVLDIDMERRVMTLHALDAADPEEIRERHHHFYERYQRKVVP